MSTSEKTAAETEPPQPKKVEHFTVGERAARGKAARAEVTRKSHGEWEPTAHRPDPVELLEEQAASRVPELVPIRYGRMLVSPFTFYRGAAYLMASDLSDGPRTGLHTQLCGDAHLSNFGVFAAPDRRMVFSVNDFDETLPGPVRMGRQAPCRELRRGGPRPRLRRQDAGQGQPDGRDQLPRGDERVRRDAEHGSLVRAHPHRGDPMRSSRRRPRPSRRSAWTRTSPRRGRRTASRRSTSSPRRSTASRGSSATRR